MLDDAARWFLEGRLSPYVRSHRLAGEAVSILCECARPAGDMSDPAIPALVVIKNAGRPCTARYDLGAGEVRRSVPRGGVVVNAADFATDIVCEAPHVIRAAVIPVAFARPLLEEERPNAADPMDLGEAHRRGHHDDAVTRIFDLLWSEAGQDGTTGRLVTEGLVTSLLGALAAANGKLAATPSSAVAGALQGWRLRRVRDYAEAHFATDVSLADLAAAAGLSSMHFARAFRRATGESPHRWLMALRVERAKDMLAARNVPLAEVALSCGFADQSHFTAVFRRHVGVTPGRFRDALRV